jgi:uncharacterized protein (TIGR00255 family)
MILSMTGYGRSEKKGKNFSINVEIKSINNRFYDPIPKIHPFLKEYEIEILSLIKNECNRGRVFININIDRDNSINSFQLNKNKLKSYLAIINDISKEAKIKESISLSHLLRYQDIIENTTFDTGSSVKKNLIIAVKDAIKDLNKFRSEEGKNLLSDINLSLDKNYSLMKKINKISESDAKKELEKYKKKIKSYMPNLSKLDDDRLYQEIAIILEKKDINEEIVRLDSHFKLFSLFLKSKNNEGKKKNFLLQEMNREVNTIGSKSDNVKVRHMIVEMKDNLEKIREQVQNIL